MTHNKGKCECDDLVSKTCTVCGTTWKPTPLQERCEECHYSEGHRSDCSSKTAPPQEKMSVSDKWKSVKKEIKEMSTPSDSWEESKPFRLSQILLEDSKVEVVEITVRELKVYLRKVDERAREETVREMAKNVGALRQWLNEKPVDLMVTDEHIKGWLGIKL